MSTGRTTVGSAVGIGSIVGAGVGAAVAALSGTDPAGWLAGGAGSPVTTGGALGGAGGVRSRVADLISEQVRRCCDGVGS